MVVKQAFFYFRKIHRFESSVISYGSEARTDSNNDLSMFESSVISYGSEARKRLYIGL